MQYKKSVSSPESPPLDLIELKFLPAWVKENEGSPSYSDYEGATRTDIERSDQYSGRGPRNARNRAHPRQRDRSQKGDRSAGRKAIDQSRRGPREAERRRTNFSPRGNVSAAAAPPPQIEIRFLPRAQVFENVVAQIKVGTTAYSIYALARLFLQKPERYDVRVTGKGETLLFHLQQMGEIATDREQLESAAFRALKDDYYKVEVNLSDPVKGNFTSIARERSSGVVLGPTNHHGYQPQLRRLYEQRFSHRMSFPEFQRQIEIVTDPELVERWKEEARKVTTFATTKEESPLTFNSEAEAERDFRQKHLPALITETRDVTIDGVSSRKLSDRPIARLIENAWSAELRSPSNIMQELTGKLRGSGLHVFRHRKGMLFVSSVRPKLIEEAALSDSVRAILELVKARPQINRKDLAEKLILPEMQGEAAEKAKLALASDLRWLIHEGHIIEFNDGSLDLPRVKPPHLSRPTQEVAPNSPAPPSPVQDNKSTAIEIAPAPVES